MTGFLASEPLLCCLVGTQLFLCFQYFHIHSSFYYSSYVVHIIMAGTTAIIQPEEWCITICIGTCRELYFNQIKYSSCVFYLFTKTHLCVTHKRHREPGHSFKITCWDQFLGHKLEHRREEMRWHKSDACTVQTCRQHSSTTDWKSRVFFWKIVTRRTSDNTTVTKEKCV